LYPQSLSLPGRTAWFKPWTASFEKAKFSPPTTFLKLSEFSTWQSLTIVLLEKDLERGQTAEELDSWTR